jgi:asparagine synthase (glutamine-hydrolysing)
MLAALRHRGPDDEGELIAPNAAIGVRRLGIIDLTGGHQPVWNENRTVAAICNGEIYNFKSLRDELAGRGHRFATNCDTEVLVHGWEEWSTDLVTHLRGMFAFAIAELPDGLDGKVRHVFVARDRLGIKPFYYAVVPQGLVFASEVRALLASHFVRAQLSSTALEGFLFFGAVSEPEALIEGVRSLPPGHAMHIDLRQPLIDPTPHPWWDFARHIPPVSAADAVGFDSAARALRVHLEESIREHLIADVPLGIFLSGGLDSTAIAALASREQRGVRTFTVAFNEKEFSEAELARRTAARLGTEHCELLVTEEEMLSRMQEAVDAMDEPTMDGVNIWFVSEAARASGLKVALSGLGSDELFGGYSTFRNARALAQIARLGGAIPSSVAKALASIATDFPMPAARQDAWRKGVAALPGGEHLPHSFLFARLLFTPTQIGKLLKSPFAADELSPWRAWLADAASSCSDADEFQQASWLELRGYMLNVLLRDTDAMSMSHSLEVRVPFLDHRIVEFALGLPAAANSVARPKALLVEALGDLLPEEIIAQPKRTFTLPWERWLRGRLRDRIAASFANPAPALVSRLNFDAVTDIWRNFLRGRTSWSRPWSLFVLNEWARRHLSADG